MNQVKFAFEAEMWNETVKHTFNLTKVFRQRDQSMWPFKYMLCPSKSQRSIRGYVERNALW